MQVKEAMCKQAEYISKSTNIMKAAQKMQELECGFLPVGDDDKLDGVITDRDIVLRVVAAGKDPRETEAGEILTDKVLYCFEDDSLEEAAKSMKEQQVLRLIVLNNKQDKRLKGIITLGDISRATNDKNLVGETSCCVAKAA